MRQQLAGFAIASGGRVLLSRHYITTKTAMLAHDFGTPKQPFRRFESLGAANSASFDYWLDPTVD